MKKTGHGGKKSSSDKTKNIDKTDHDQAKSIICYLDGKLEDIRNDLTKAKKTRLQANIPSFKSEGNRNQYIAILEIESQAKKLYKQPKTKDHQRLRSIWSAS